MSNKEKKFSKSGILIVSAMVIAFVIILAVALPGGFGSLFEKDSKDLNDDGAPSFSDVMDKGSPIMIFDKRDETKALLAAYDNDEIVSVDFLGSNGEGNGSESDSAIVDAYRALKNIIVGEKIEKPAKAAIYDVNFVLADGTKCPFEFAEDEDECAVNLDGVWYQVAGFSDLLEVIMDM
ncbi:MAG: hypothetical protein PUB09_05125 [Firmicutes bacterium]|nr:hypothetical protein [Bacillota bacterium]